MAELSRCFASSDVTTMHSNGWMLKPEGARSARASTFQGEKIEEENK